MVKNILKRLLSTMLVLLLVATTFFIFDPSAVFPTAEATVSRTNYNSTDAVTFVVPEVIYLQPVYNAYKAATTSTFKYYVNDSASWGVTTGESTSGNIYFYYKNAKDSKADISFTWETTPGTANSATSTITFGNSTAKGPNTAYTASMSTSQAISITAGNSPSLAAATTGIYIRWKAVFTDTVDGLSKTAYAYTYVYKPYPMPVANGIRDVNTRGTNSYAQSIGFVSGIHGIKSTGGGKYPQVNTSNGLVTISGGGSTTTNATPLVGSYFKSSGMNNTGCEAWLNGSSSVSDESAHYYNGGDSNGTNGDEYCTAVSTTAAVGKITVDSSRYTNMSQIPMLTVGVLLTDNEEDSDATSGAAFASNNDNNIVVDGDFRDYWNTGQSNDRAKWDTPQSKAWYTRGTRGSWTTINEGIVFNVKWSLSTPSSSQRNITVGYANTASDELFNVHGLKVYVYNWSRSDLRTAYANAIKSMNRCNETLLKSAKWTEFYNLFKAVAAQLCKVDQTGYTTVSVNSTSYSSASALATALTNAASNYAAQSTTYRDTYTAKQYNIKVYLDGSTWKLSASSGNTTTTSDAYYKGAKVQYGASTPNGYTYKGYVKDYQETQTTANSATAKQSSNMTATSGDYSVAHATGEVKCSYYYLRNNYTITYATDGGSAISAKTYHIESSDTLPAASGKSGYTFSTWKVTTAGGSWSANATFGSGTSLNGKYGNVTLTAQWTANTYAVTLDQWRGSGGTTSVQATYASNMPSATMPSRTGYTFGGYYDGTLGSGTQYYTASGGSARTWNKTSATTLYAKWTANSYNITYNLNGGALASGVTNPTSFNVVSTPAKLNNPTKNGYTFAGWTGSNGTTKQTDVYVPTNMITDSTLNGYTRTSPWTCSGRDHFTGNQITVAQGEVYRVIVDGKRTAGSLGINGGLWYTAQSSGAAYDGYSGVFVTADTDTSSASVTANTWYTFYKDVTIPAGKTGAKCYIQLDQNSSGGSTSWQIANVRIIKLADACSDKSYTANWTTVSYSITYDLAGGSLASGVTNPTSYTIETNTFTLNNPSKGGYTFSGWTGSNGGTASTSVQVTKGSTGNKNFTANWSANLYTLTFDANGGTDKSAISYRPTDSVTLGSTTKNGYDFVNWKVTSAGGTWNANSTWASTQSVSGKYGNATLQAQWTAASYSISYAGLSGISGWVDATGTTNPNPTSYTIETTSFTLKNPTKTGYNFAGWTGTGLNSATTTVTVSKGSTGNRSYTATWSTVSYSISYNYASGALPSGTTNPSSYTIETATFSLNNPQRSGYTFAGWTGTGLQSATTTVTIAKGSTGARSYTATWTANTYTVTLNQQSGTGGSTSVTATFGSAMPSATMPTRSGYTFGGYYDQTNGNGNMYYKADGTSNKNWDKATNSTLYAKWTIITYGISYVLDGGTNHADNPTTYKITDNNITLKDASKTGYNFTGWTGNGTTTPTKNLVLPAGSTGDKTFTANWSAIKYTISTSGVNPNGLTGLKWGTNNAATNPNKTEYYITSAAITLVNPSRAGYTFTGWTGSNGTTPQTTVTIAKGSTGNKTYTANFSVQSYDMTFVPNGGTFSASGGFTANSSNQTKKITYGSTYGAADGNNKTWPSISKTGYTFQGWKDSSNNSYSSTGTVSVTNAITVTAQWDIITYAIEINYAGGSATNPTGYKVTDDAFTLAQPTRTGYTFQGYTGTGLSSATKSVTVTPGTGTTSGLTNVHQKLEFTATWTADTYNITYTLPTGATNAAGNPATYTIESADITLADASKTGWTFKGWTGNGTTTATKNLVLPHGSTGDKTFTANFTANKYTVTLDSKLYADASDTTGSAATSAGTTSVQATYDSAMPSATMPTLTGYTFGGYFDTKLGSGNQYYKAGGGSNRTWNKTSNTTLYAKWTINTSTLKVDPNGGTWSGSTNAQTFTQNYNTKKSIAAAERSGYTFTGWTLDNSGGGNGTWNSNTNEYTFGSIADKTDVLTAGWSAVKYTISTSGVIPSGLTGLKWGTNNATTNPNPTEYYITSSAITLVNPKRAGYTFKGWSGTDLTGDSNTTVTIAAGSTGNRTYTANFTANKIDLTFDPNGGYFTDDANGFTTGTTQTGTQSKKVTYASTYGAADANGKTWPNVARTGYDFKKWTSDGTNSGTEYKSTGSVTITSATTIKAYWAEHEYKISYTMNSGTNNSSNKTKYKVTDAAFQMQNPSRAAYDFKGWSGTGLSGDTNKNFTITPGTGATSGLNNVHEDLSFTANWTPTTYTITYDLVGGSLQGSQTNPGNYNIETPTFTLKNPVKTGYAFQGWYGGVIGGTQSTSTSVQIAKGSTGNRKYTATWQAKEYTVALNMVGGRDGTEQVTATFDAAMPTPIELPVKDGYDFAGYFNGTVNSNNEVQYGNKQYYDDEGASARAWDVDSTSTTTLYAKWTPTEWTITFKPNGGANVYNNNTLGYNIESTNKLVDSTRGGYTFNGWKPESDAGNWVRTSTYSGGDGTTTGFSLQGMWGNVTLVAQWKAAKFTITYNSNGGDSTPSALDYYITTNLTLASDPGKTGYDFQGWLPQTAVGNWSTTQGNYSGNIGAGKYGNVTLVAQWTAQTYTLTFELDGGTLTAGGGFTTADHQTKTVTYGQTYGKKFSTSENKTWPNDPSKVGYDFGGWKNGNTTFTSGGQVTITEDTTLTAKWTIKSYNVTVNTANSGTATSGYGMASVATGVANPANYNSTVTLQYTASAGYQFKNWSSTDVTVNNQNKFTMPAKAVTVTANFEPITYTITYNLNEGTVATANPTTYTIETPSFSLNNPEKTGYTFKGWTGSNSQDTPETTVTIASSTGNLSYVANWTPKKYSVTLDRRGGTGGSTGVQATFGAAMPAASKPSKNGYDFAGYYKNSDGTGTQYYDANCASAHVWDQPNNSTIYAKWTIKTFNISYTLAGGTVATANPETYTITSPDITLNNPTRTGYDFAGWTGTGLETASTSVTIPTGSYGDRTYTATWTIITYTITYDLADGSLGTGVTNPGTYTVETATFNLNNPSKPGWQWAGWKGGVVGATPTTAATVTIAKGSTGNRSYLATYTPRQYTLNFVSDGDDQDIPSLSYKPNQSFTLGDTTKEGHTFAGWEVTQSTSTPTTWTMGSVWSADTSVKDKYGNATLTATWTVNNYTLTVDPNGGTFNSTTDPSNFTQAYGTTKSLGAASRTGYTFEGWQKISGKGTYAANSNPKTGGIFTYGAGAARLQAVWTAITYTITYNYGVGQGSVTNPGSYTIETPTFTLNNPTADGYTFDGWTGTDLGAMTTTVTITKGRTGNRTFTANWSKNTYTVTLDRQGGTTGSVEVSATYNEAMPSASMPTRAGYDFKGYYASPNGVGTQYYTAGGNSANVWDQPNDSTIYANWTAQTYTLTFFPAGGYFDVDAGNNGGGFETGEDATNYQTKQVTYGGKYGDRDSSGKTWPANMTYPGYTFSGWKNGNTTFTATGNVTITADTNLTAQWTRKTFTVAFDMNGVSASVSPASKTLSYGLSSTYAPAPTKTDATDAWVFRGWSTNRNTTSGTVAAQNSTISATTVAGWFNDVGEGGTKTVYAIWQKTLTGTFKDGRGDDMVATTIIYNGATSGQITIPAQRNFDGWTKMGWTTSTSNTATADKTSTKFTIAASAITTDNTDVKYYGRYDRTVAVTYNANGGDTTPNPTSVTQQTNGYNISNWTNKTVTLASAITRGGYTFSGWLIGSDTYKGGATYTITGNVEAVAQWTLNDFTVTIDPNEGSVSSIKYYSGGTTSENLEEVNDVTETVELTTVHGTTMRMALPARNGYSFAGWAVTATDGGNLPADGVITNSSLAESTYLVGAGDVTLTATWQAKQYVLRYASSMDDNLEVIGGTFAYDEEVTVEDWDVLENDYPGYAFTDWAISVSTEGDTYVAGDTFTLSDYAEVIFDELDLDENNNPVVYMSAEWEPASYQIRYDTNGFAASAIKSAGKKTTWRWQEYASGDYLQKGGDGVAALSGAYSDAEFGIGSYYYVSTATDVRFGLGWSFDPNATEPDIEFLSDLTIDDIDDSVLANAELIDEESHLYELTLYMVWSANYKPLEDSVAAFQRAYMTFPDSGNTTIRNTRYTGSQASKALYVSGATSGLLPTVSIADNAYKAGGSEANELWNNDSTAPDYALYNWVPGTFGNSNSWLTHYNDDANDFTGTTVKKVNSRIRGVSDLLITDPCTQFTAGKIVSQAVEAEDGVLETAESYMTDAVTAPQSSYVLSGLALKDANLDHAVTLEEMQSFDNTNPRYPNLAYSEGCATEEGDGLSYRPDEDTLAFLNEKFGTELNEMYPDCEDDGEGGHHSFNSLIAMANDIFSTFGFDPDAPRDNTDYFMDGTVMGFDVDEETGYVINPDCVYTTESVYKLFDLIYGRAADGTYKSMVSGSFNLGNVALYYQVKDLEGNVKLKIPSQVKLNKVVTMMAYGYHSLEMAEADYSEFENLFAEYFDATWGAKLREAGYNVSKSNYISSFSNYFTEESYSMLSRFVSMYFSEPGKLDPAYVKRPAVEQEMINGRPEGEYEGWVRSFKNGSMDASEVENLDSFNFADGSNTPFADRWTYDEDTDEWTFDDSDCTLCGLYCDAIDALVPATADYTAVFTLIVNSAQRNIGNEIFYMVNPNSANYTPANFYPSAANQINTVVNGKKNYDLWREEYADRNAWSRTRANGLPAYDTDWLYKFYTKQSVDNLSRVIKRINWNYNKLNQFDVDLMENGVYAEGTICRVLKDAIDALTPKQYTVEFWKGFYDPQVDTDPQAQEDDFVGSTTFYFSGNLRMPYRYNSTVNFQAVADPYNLKTFNGWNTMKNTLGHHVSTQADLYTVNFKIDDVVAWGQPASGTPTAVITTTDNVNYTITLYAEWVDNVTLDIDMDGGTAQVAADGPQGTTTFTATANANDAGNHPTFDYRTTLTFSNMSKEGYQFDRWVFQKGANNTASTFEGNVYTFGYGSLPKTNDRLLAKWTGNPYTVTFHANYAGATQDDYTQSFRYGVAQTLTPNAFTRTGWNFTNWVDSNGVEYTDGQSVSNLTTQLNGNVDLYAEWEVADFTLTFKNDFSKPDWYDENLATFTWAAWSGAAATNNDLTKTITAGQLYGKADAEGKTWPSDPTITYVVTNDFSVEVTFDGWWTQKDSGGTKITAASNVTVTENQDLYPHFNFRLTKIEKDELKIVLETIDANLYTIESLQALDAKLQEVLTEGHEVTEADIAAIAELREALVLVNAETGAKEGDVTPPTVSMYENKAALQQAINNGTIVITEQNADDIEYMLSESTGETSYVFPGKAYYTYYCYTNSAQPAIMLSASEVLGESGRASYPVTFSMDKTGTNSKNQVRTRSGLVGSGWMNYSQDVTDPEDAGYNPNRSAGYNIGTNYVDNPYKGEHALQYVGRDYDNGTGYSHYMYEQYILLKPTFDTSYVGKQYALYTFEVTDDSVGDLAAATSTLAGAANTNSATADLTSTSNEDVTPTNTITIFVEYFNSMNGHDGDAGGQVVNQTTGIGKPNDNALEVYTKFHENGYQNNVWVNTDYLYRNSAGLANGDYISPVFKAEGSDTYDTFYVANDPIYGQTDVGSFYYLMKSDDAATALYWDTYDAYIENNPNDNDVYHNARVAAAQAAMGSVQSKVVKDMQNPTIRDKMNNTWPQNCVVQNGDYVYWPYSGSTQWNARFTAPARTREDTLVYVHIYDRYGNHYTNILQRDLQDTQAATANVMTRGEVTINELGGSGIQNITIYELNTKKKANVGGMTDGQTWNVVDNQFTITGLPEGTNDYRYTMTITDNAGGEQTVNFQANADGSVVVTVNDETMGGSYANAANAPQNTNNGVSISEIDETSLTTLAIEEVSADEILIDAIPEEQLNGDAAPAARPDVYTFTVNDAYTVNLFADSARDYEVTLSATAGGTVKAYVNGAYAAPQGGKITVPAGSHVQIRLSPSTGYELQSLTMTYPDGRTIDLVGAYDALIDDDVTIQAVFAPTAALLRVRVENGAVSGKSEMLVSPNSRVTVVADTAPAGMVFAYWTQNGGIAPVSYDSIYTFIATSDVDLSAVYANETVEKTANIEMDLANPAQVTLVNGKYNLAYSGKITLPEGAQIEEFGLVLTNQSSDDCTADNFVIGGTVNGKNVAKLVGQTVTDESQCMINVNNVAAGQTRTGRLYMTVKFADGTTQTIYSSTWAQLDTPAA